MWEFLLCILITIVIHELAHMLTALKCGVGVEVFSVGFGKPILKKKIKNIEYRLTPFLIGGYCQLKGELRKKYKDDFLYHPYRHKFAILVAGVTVNFLLACLCYLINYGSISFGMRIDFSLLGSLLTRNYIAVERILHYFKPNPFLLQLSLLNIGCAITNLFPIPALDGGWLWLLLLEKKWKKNFIKRLRIINGISFYLLMYLQIVFLYWIFFV